jgi:hypothetical protein
MTTLLPSAELLLRSGVIYLCLFAVGFTLLLPLYRSRWRSAGVLSPIVGLVVIQILSWHWLDLGKRGLNDLHLVVLMPCIAITLVFIWRQRSQWTSITSVLESRTLQALVWSSLFTFLVFVLQWQPLLAQGRLTIAGGNADVAAYAQVAQHLESWGFADAGRIVGANLGGSARSDVFGAYVFVAIGKAVTWGSVSTAMLPVLLVAFLFTTIALTRLLLILTSLPTKVIGLIVGFAQSVAMIGYLGGCYFLSQIIGMGLVLTILVEFAKPLNCPGERKISTIVLRTIVVSLMAAGGILTYPQMVAVVPVVLLPSLCFVTGFKGAIGRATIYITAVGVGAVLVWPRVGPAIQRARALAGDKTNGWPLPFLYPSELMGFKNPIDGGSRITAQVLSAVLAILIAFGSWHLWKSGKHSSTKFSLAIIALTLGTYLVVYRRGNGPTYQQWKWVTFFLPIFVVVVLVLIVGGVFVSLANRPRALQVVVVAIVGLVVLNLAKYRMFYNDVARAYPVTEELEDINESPALNGIEELNVAAGIYLWSMWPTVFLEGRRVSIVEPSYYSSAALVDAWTLVRTTNTEIIRPPETRAIGSDFYLIPPPPAPLTLDAKNLGAIVSASADAISIKAGEPLMIKYSVKNTGLAAWMNNGAEQGSIHLGVRLYNANTMRLVADIARVVLSKQPGYLAPGETAEGTLTTVINEPGTYALVVTPVSEFVTWFNDLNPAFSRQINVNVN